MIMMMMPMMTVIPIAATNSEDAIDGTHRAANTGADRAANDRADRSRRAATLAHAPIGTPLHTADDTLRPSGMRNRQERESKRCGCKCELDGYSSCPHRCRLRPMHPVHLDSSDFPDFDRAAISPVS